MNREEISKKLSLINSCLGKQDYIDVLTHICFKDGNAITYNGTQAAIVDIDLDFNCTVPGSLFQKLVNSYSLDSIDLDKKDNELMVSCGKSIAKFSTFPSEDYIFDAESVKDSELQLVVDSDFVNGVLKCLVSVSDNFVDTSQSGITLDISKEGVFLYSTNGICLSKYIISQKGSRSEKVILPKLFCTQLINWHNVLGDGMLHVGFDYVKVEFNDGNAILFSQTDSEVKFLDFEETIAQSYYEDTEVIIIPDKLKDVLQRCQLMISGNVEQLVELDIIEDSVNFLAQSANGVHNVTDTIKVEGIGDDCSFRMDCTLLSKGLEYADKMVFAPDNPAGIDVVIFVGISDNFLHLISSS